MKSNSTEPVTTEYVLRTELPYWDKSYPPSETFTYNASLIQSAWWSKACFFAITQLAWRAEQTTSNGSICEAIRNLAEIGHMLTANCPELVEKLTESIHADHDLDFPEEVF